MSRIKSIRQSLKALQQSLKALISLWFGFHAPVSRRAYLFSGLFFFCIKLTGDMVLLHRLTGELWTFAGYFSPFLMHREDLLNQPQVITTLGLWSLPFIWIGASMTARRARDADVSPLITGVFFVPGINYFLMLALSLAPSATPTSADDERDEVGFNSLLKAVLLGALAGGVMLISAFVILDSPYGMGLFAGGPFVIGFVTSFLYRGPKWTLLRSQGVVQLALLTGAGSLLLLGVEGGLCILMAYPLAAPLAAIGGFVGRAMAEPRRFGLAHLMMFIALTPLITALDHGLPEPEFREIVTTIVVDAPPEEVWPHVVEFSELPPPEELIFRAGIAYPIRARIEGEGVGAVRYCEFSTGAFVEPITHWEEPYRLAFDVVEQPPTMKEWSPYDIHPPHLTGSLRSQKGEFRLIALDSGRTRLEGHTWYRHDLFPQAYWNLWSDPLIHQIHRRVLGHIAERSEGG